jgi:hypothetical protein
VQQDFTTGYRRSYIDPTEHALVLSVDEKSPGESDVLDRRVIAGDDEERLSLAGLVGDDNCSAGARYGEMIRRPYCAIEIRSRIDHDRVAVPGDLRRRAWQLQRPLWTDF